MDGITYFVDIGSTKILAKLANRIVKQHPEFNVVCDLNSLSLQQQEEWFKEIEVGEI